MKHVPKAYDEKLYNWARKYRAKYRNGDLKPDRIKQLNEIDFDWEKRKRTWDENYIKLKEYKKIHGDCNVPQHYLEDSQLSTFVRRHRKYLKQGILSKVKKINLHKNMSS